jgi:hypothetical protein
MSADTSRTRADLAAVGGKVGGEPRHGGVVAALGGEQHPGLGRVQVHEQAHVVLPALGGGLVDADPGDLDHRHLRAGLVDVVVQQPPQPGVVLADQHGDRLDRHLGQQRHQQRLKQQGEPAAGPRPGKRHLPGPVRWAGHPWHAGVQVGLVLEEVQVPPGLGLGVVDRAGGLVAVGAGEAGAFGEVQAQVQPAGRGVEPGPGHLPGFGKAKSSLEQVVDRRHQRSSSLGSWRTDPTA